ncbi:hypothetical protein [Roseateles asaccharophilus]|uniref:hypothetical protein n=1 Tax=Roseateles asaccharophilus TaxID=582607 RepID=UPI00384C2BF8
MNQDLTPLHSVAKRTTSRMYIPEWLRSLAGPREMQILQHPHACTFQEDQEGNRYPPHQQWIESPVGTMLICSRERKILN